MEIVHDLLEAVLRLVLTRHVVEADALRRLHIDLGIALAHAEHHGVLSAVLGHNALIEHLADKEEQHQRQQSRQQIAEKGRGGLRDILREFCAGFVQPLRERGVVHHAGLIDLRFVLVGEDDLAALDLYLADVLFLDHAHERAIIGLLDLRLHQQRRDDPVEQQDHDQNNAVVVEQRLFR